MEKVRRGHNMQTSSWKICKIRNIRKLCAHRLKILLGLFVAIIFVYEVVPKLPLKKPPWTFLGWRDTDFRLNVDESEIIVLRWTSQWGAQYDADVLTAEKCPYLKPSPEAASGAVFDIPCRITYDRRYLRASDALVFHSWDLLNEEIPNRRSRDQVWVYLQQECPGYTKLDLRDFPNVFNWTMTYRRDSDIYHPYGHIVPHTQPNTGSSIIPNSSADINHNLTKRAKLVAWIVSSCDSNSKREYFVNELQKYIPISIYGWCGQDCPPDTNSTNCYDHVSKMHKFYLSFENTLCSDYITEKFFNALKSNLVPVVYGGTASEEYSVIAPEGSYIDTRKFKTPKHLVEYLVYLDQNEEEYMKYFEWKREFKVIFGQGWCHLCQRVFEHLQFAPDSSTSVSSEQKRKYTWYKDLWTWWNYQSYSSRLEEDRLSGTSRTVNKDRVGTPACSPPIKEFTRFRFEGAKLDLKPSLLNGKALSKWGKWAKDGIFG